MADDTKIFEERVDVNACEWLLSQMSATDFHDQLTEGDKENNQVTFAAAKKILNSFKKHKGVLKTKYTKSIKDIHHNGRDYGRGIQCIPCVYRGLICRNTMTDVDMKNCHPTILHQLCLKHDVPCKYLSDYVLNRSEILKNNGLVKLDIIKSMFKKSFMNRNNPWFKCFDAEMKTIQKAFISNPEFVKQKEQSVGNRYNQEGSFMFALCSSFEVLILNELIKKVNVKIGVLMFDGFLFYGERPKDFLETLNTLGKNVGFDMEWTYKEHDTSLEVPGDFKSDDDDVLYALVKDKYERDHKMAFIETTNCISYKIDDVVHYFSRSDMMFKMDDVEIGKEPFFTKWSKDPDKQRFNRVGVYPHDTICPNSVLNLWNGYDVEKIQPEVEPLVEPALPEGSEPEVEPLVEQAPAEGSEPEVVEPLVEQALAKEPENEVVEPEPTLPEGSEPENEVVEPEPTPEEGSETLVSDLFMNHLKIICKESVVLEFLLDWLANMFQYPSSQSIMVIIQGEEGSGKSVICDFITKILGRDYCIEINSVEHALFGRFNAQLVNKVFANINEIDRTTMSAYAEQLKAIITQPTLTIEDKGKKRFEVANLLHFMTTCNNDNAFKITENSRRFMYLETSNELIGKTDYFAALFHYINQPKNQRRFYDLMMNRPVKKQITVKDIPITDDMRKQFEFNRDPIEDYAREFTFKLTSMENYNAYKTYLLANGLKFEKPKKAFDMAFAKYMDKNEIHKKKMMVDGVRELFYIKTGYEKTPDADPY